MCSPSALVPGRRTDSARHLPAVLTVHSGKNGEWDCVTDTHFSVGLCVECSCLLAVYPDASRHPALLSCCAKDLMAEDMCVPCGSELSVISIMNACTSGNSLCLELKRTKCLFELYC